MKQKSHKLAIVPAVVAALALAMESGLLAQVPGYSISTLGSFVNTGGVATDSLGNVYVSDDQADLIQKISPTGTITAVAGGGKCTGGLVGDSGPATSACIASPAGLAFDAAGNLYIADSANNRVRKVTSTSGVITTVAGPGTGGILGDGGPATSASLSNPQGVAVDGGGNLYIADTGHGLVREVSPTGTITTIAGGGATSALGDGGPATSAFLSHPEGIALDSAANVYVADYDHSRVRKVSAGVITTVAGNGGESYTGDGGPATLATLYLPSALAIDSANNIYIADTGNHRIRLVTPAGTINTIAGGGVNGGGNTGVATSVVLQGNVSGVALGTAGTVYLSSVIIAAGTGLQQLKPTGTTISPGPSIPASGVVSVSGWGQFKQLGIGSWTSIYGSYLASDSRAWTASDFNGINAPTSLDGTSVTIGGQPAFVSYISPGQINAQVPTNIGTGTQPLIVTTPQGTSATYPVTVNSQEPGLLAPPSFQLGLQQYVVALFQDGTFVLPTGAIPGLTSRPAKAGDVITLYGIGFGRVVPDTPAGQIVQTAPQLAASFQLFFNSTPVQVSYAGLNPGVVGLYQFNVTVPSGTVSGGAAILTFTLGGVESTQDLYIAAE